MSTFGQPIIFLAIAVLLCTRPSHAGSYSDNKAILDTVMASSRYDDDIRPVLDQSDITYIDVAFELVSIKEINDVIQSFECNAFLALFWTDEVATWNVSDYGGEAYITPKPKDVWRPRMVLLNTMDKRDLFEDDAAPMSIDFNGQAQWTPGAIFPTACNMDLTNYPYDKQTCGLMMIPMNYDATEVIFRSLQGTVGDIFYNENGEWEIESTLVLTPFITVGSSNLSCIQIQFNLKRRPAFVILSILLPIVFLSLLNILVFLIPVDSGEKISYGITVLLALTVFMSIISGMLPSSSNSMPLIIIYIFILLIISVLTVVDAIVIVKLHHMEAEEEKYIKAKRSFKTAHSKISLLRNAIVPLSATKSKTGPGLVDSQPNGDKKDKALKDDDAVSLKTDKGDVNKFKIISKHIDYVSLLVFALAWIGVTLGFFITIST